MRFLQYCTKDAHSRVSTIWPFNLCRWKWCRGSRMRTGCNLMVTSWFTRSTWFGIIQHNAMQWDEKSPWESKGRIAQRNLHERKIKAKILITLSDRNSAWRQFTSPNEFTACQGAPICSQSINFKSENRFIKGEYWIKYPFYRHSSPSTLTFYFEIKIFSRSVCSNSIKLQQRHPTTVTPPSQHKRSLIIECVVLHMVVCIL